MHSILEIIYRNLFLGVLPFCCSLSCAHLLLTLWLVVARRKHNFADHHILSGSFTLLKESEQLTLHGNLRPIYE